MNFYFALLLHTREEGAAGVPSHHGPRFGEAVMVTGLRALSHPRGNRR